MINRPVTKEVTRPVTARTDDLARAGSGLTPGGSLYALLLENGDGIRFEDDSGVLLME